MSRPSRAELLRLEGDAADALAMELSRFPSRPRGKQPGRRDASALASEVIATRKQEGASGYEAMLSAAANVRKLASDFGYEPPDPEKASRLKVRPGAVFVSHDDQKAAELAEATAIAAGLGREGRGNRTQHRELGEMVKALLHLRREGVPIPAPTIRREHLKSQVFVEVLERQRFLLRSGIEAVDVIEGRITGEGLRSLNKAVRHRIQAALDVVDALHK